MHKRLFCMLLALCLAGSLVGCSAFSFGNVTEMLRAPALGEEYGQVQRALEAYVQSDLDVKTNIEYKYPREGSQRSPLLMVDLDGDGQDECVAFYSLTESDASRVYMAVLQQTAEEGWQVAHSLEGTAGATEVASVSVADMFGTGANQLVVGFSYANLSNKSLALYSYQDGSFVAVSVEGYYDRYLLSDFTGTGNIELAVVLMEESRRFLQFYTGENGKFERKLNTRVDLYSEFDTCLGLYASVNAEGERFLVLDGTLPVGQNQLGTQVLAYASETGRYYVPQADDGALRNAINETLREGRSLTSRDLGDNGLVLTPVAVGEMAESMLAEGLALEFIQWFDFTAEEPSALYFGIYDATHSLYVQLPQGWQGTVEIVAGEQTASWNVVNAATGAVLLQLLDDPDEVPEDAVFITGTQSVYLVPGNNILAAERWAIKAMVLT